MMKNGTLLVALVAACFCAAEEITLADGETLHDARVLRQDAESVTLAHSAGVARVIYSRLTPELQQRFGLTPAEVEARREKALQAERERAAAREKKMAEQRAALAASNLSPRYVTGVELVSLYGGVAPLSAVGAEYLAAEWNYREALRCGLTIEAERYKEESAKWLPKLQQEQREAQQADEDRQVWEERWKHTEDQLKQARQEIKKLRTELEERPRSTTTIVTSSPTYVPVFQPPPRPPAPVFPSAGNQPSTKPPAPRPAPRSVRSVPAVKPGQPLRPGRAEPR